MKPWMMPRVRIERFAANEYVSSCENSKTYLRVYAPVQETNGVPGWQEHDNGHGIDTNGVAEDGYLNVYLDQGNYHIVRASSDEFEYDNANTYYLIELTQDVVSTTGKEYKKGTILYKNYNPGAGLVEEIIKNYS